MAIFTATSSITEAVRLLQNIPTAKLPLIIRRILDKLQSPEEIVFTNEECQKLSASYSLTTEELDLVLTTCKFFFSQAAYHSSKPAVFGQHLKGVGLDDEKCEIFQHIWSEKAKSVLAQLRKKSIAAQQLETINWQLSLQIAQKSKSKQKKPCATFELGIKDNQKQTQGRVQIEFDHQELYQFFNQLDTIQTQLDGLT